MGDLVVLTADRNACFALKALLSRTKALSISVIEADFLTHPGHDPGVAREAVSFLRPYLQSHRYALVTLDYEGCGKAGSAENIEKELEEELGRNGWQDRSSVIIFEPELERWIWNGSDSLASFFRLGTFSQLRKGLVESGYIFDSMGKPVRPKEAFEFMMAKSKIQRSSSMYKKLALSLPLRNCTERGYLKLCSVLCSWFKILH